MRLSPSILCWEKEKVPSSQRTLEWGFIHFNEFSTILQDKMEG